MQNQLYSVDEFAQKIRDSFPGGYYLNADIGKMSNEDLKDFYIQHHPDSKSLLENPYDTYSSRWRPKEAGNRFTGFFRDLKHGIKSKAIKLPASMSNAINTLIDPNVKKQRLDERISVLEDALASGTTSTVSGLRPGGLKDGYGQMSEEDLQRRVRETILPDLYKQRDILDDVKNLSEKHDSFLSDGAQADLEALEASYSFGDKIDFTVKKALYDASTKGFMPFSIWQREWANETIDEWVANDDRLQAALKWQRDVPFDSWDDVFMPDMMLRAFSEVGSSMIVMAAGGSITKAPKIASALTGANKIQGVMQAMGGGSGALVTMGLMEGDEAVEETIRYLTEEYTYLDEDGNRQNATMEQALPVAGVNQILVGLINAPMERLQFRTMGKMLGFSSGMSKSVIRGRADWLMKKYYPKGLKHRGYKTTMNVLDIGVNGWQEGLIEGYQEEVQWLAAEALKQGYDINKPWGISDLISNAGLKANEVGLNNLYNPYTSDIPRVKEAALTGMSAFVGGGSVQAGRRGWSDYNAGPDQDSALEDAEQDIVDGNLDKDAITRKDDLIHIKKGDKQQIIQADNSDHAKNIEDNLIQNANSRGADAVQAIAIPLETVSDYLNIILDQMESVPGVKSNRSLSKKLPTQLNAIQKLIRKHASSGPANSEARFRQKISDLLSLKDDKGNPIVTKKVIEELKSKAGTGRKKVIEAFESIAVDAIKDNVKSKVKKATAKGMKGANLEIVNKKIDEFFAKDDTFKEEDIISAYLNPIALTGDIVSNEYAQEINKKILSVQDQSGKKMFNFAPNIEALINQKIDNDILRAESNFKDLESNRQSNIDAMAKKGSLSNEIAITREQKFRDIYRKNPVKDVNGKDVSGASLLAAFALRYANNPNSIQEKKQDVIDIILGQRKDKPNAPAVNMTNISRVFKELGVKRPKNATKAQLADIIAANISDILSTPVVSDQSNTILDSQLDEVSQLEKKLEKDIEDKAMKALIASGAEIIDAPKKKAPAKKPEDKKDLSQKPTEVVEDETQRIDRLRKEGEMVEDGTKDPLLYDAAKLVINEGKATVSLIQRKLRVGYSRAGRLIDALELLKIIGEHKGAKPRDILFKKDMADDKWIRALTEIIDTVLKPTEVVEDKIEETTPEEILGTVDASALGLTASEIAQVKKDALNKEDKIAKELQSDESASKAATEIDDDLNIC